MMIKYTLSLVFVLFLASCFGQIKSSEVQIAEALFVVPDGFKEGAKVYGYDSDGNFVTLREGTNEMVCLADDPNKAGFGVAAYHKELDEFMARGRALKAEGKGFKEIFDMREEEVKGGKLKMPDKSLLYVMSGEYDDNGEATNLYTRFVFYIPYATAESTGLPTSPVVVGAPWIMDPGTHRAHIMINPPKN
jgi:hypothetical protein